MNKMVLTAIAWIIDTAFRMFSLFPQQRKIVFLSRQSSRPFDFVLLEPELARRLPDRKIIWACVGKGGHLGIFVMLRQLWHAATAEVCLVDGYVPAVCIPRGRKRAVCIQLWHALGAIKRFGYQCLDMPAGRSSAAAQALRMHRGYDYVIAGLAGAVPSFSEAFDCPFDGILPLGLPRIDYLLSPVMAEMREIQKGKLYTQLGWADSERAKAVVLYAPTFRKGTKTDDWLEAVICDFGRVFPPDRFTVLVAGHPLQKGCESEVDESGTVTYLSGVSTIDVLHSADYVVTDYSAIAFEAGLLGLKVLFYVPDIEEYRVSPGLNIDPLVEFPSISYEDCEELSVAVINDLDGETYDRVVFSEFMARYADGLELDCIARIGALVERGCMGVSRPRGGAAK